MLLLLLLLLLKPELLFVLLLLLLLKLVMQLVLRAHCRGRHLEGERSRSGSLSGSRRRRRLLAPTTYGADVSFVVAASAAALGLGGPADFTQAYSCLLYTSPSPRD